jgi:hypothetical protein
MTFRVSYSRLDNDPASQALSSLEIVLRINNIPVGRAQGLRRSGQAAPRPVNEMGSDRVVEFVPGIKTFQGTLQSITLKYGDLMKRLASAAGGEIDAQSKAATLSNMPEFDISVLDRGNPNFTSPSLYAPAGSGQNLAGTGKLIVTLIGCVVESFEQSFNVNEALVMESVSFRYIDEVVEAQDGGSTQNQLFSGFVPGNAG